MRLVRAFIGVLFLGAVALGILGAKLYLDLLRFRDQPHGSDVEKVVEIPPGSPAREVVRRLARGGALADETLAWRYVRWVKNDPRMLRSGEYAFTGPMRPDDVLEKVYKGEEKLYPVTIPEGLRAEEVAARVDEAGLGRKEELLALARDPAFARELGIAQGTLEGYLFPDTYHFGRAPKARQVLAKMVEGFRTAWRKAEAQRDPAVELSPEQAVVLASIVEKETGLPEERPRIACVFQNRLRKGMKLQTDPTVLYAKWLWSGEWSKNLTRKDLETAHPYNTYAVAGLPPGPIASPGEASLAAVLRPAACDDLYFVSRNDGSHEFCPDLRCHNAAVRRWQVEFFRERKKAAAKSARG